MPLKSTQTTIRPRKVKKKDVNRRTRECGDCRVRYKLKYISKDTCVNCRIANDLRTREVLICAYMCAACRKFISREGGQTLCAICEDRRVEVSSDSSSSEESRSVWSLTTEEGDE